MLSLEVSDNGRGLASRDLAKARSFGIRGLHERAATVGGWVDLSQRRRRHDADPVGADDAADAAPAPQPAHDADSRRRARPLGLGRPMIEVILCDDHALIRRGIRDTLSDAADIQVVGEAGDYGELRTLMRSWRQAAPATCWCSTSTCPAAAAWTCCTR